MERTIYGPQGGQPMRARLVYTRCTLGYRSVSVNGTKALPLGELSAEQTERANPSNDHNQVTVYAPHLFIIDTTQKLSPVLD